MKLIKMQNLFEDLEEVGIYQKSPVLAAKMSKVYKNIDHWWLDHNTQIIRKRFLSKYVFQIIGGLNGKPIAKHNY